MKETFWSGWSRHLFEWFAFVFTVGAATIGLALTTERWWLWVSLLIAVAAVASAAFFAYRTHRKAEELRAELARERSLREAAERKLNEIPLEMLTALQRTVAAFAVHELSQVLSRRVEFVQRMIDFSEAGASSLGIRRFVKQGGRLFVVAKAEPEALSHIRVGDQFYLVRQSADGVETRCAKLQVHQSPDPAKGLLHFEIMEPLSGEMAYVEGLAESVDVPKLKGYSVRIACKLEDYAGLDFRSCQTVITHLVQALLSEREGGA